MSVEVTVELNGVAVPVIVDDAALDKIAAALDTSPTREEPWPMWMNVDTLGRYLDCSTERVRHLVSCKSIPYVQEAHGCRVFFDREAIDHWMRQSAQPARGGEA